MMKCIQLIIAGLFVATPVVAQAPNAVTPKPCNFLKETPEMRQAERERLRAWLRSIGSKATSQEVDELQSDMQKLTKMAEDAIQAETGCFRLEEGRFIRLHPLAPAAGWKDTLGGLYRCAARDRRTERAQFLDSNPLGPRA